MKRSIVIAFEGLDNCFKQTNYELFVDFLNVNKWYSVKTESFPRYGNWAAIAAEKWLDGSLDRNHLKNNKQALVSLYSIDRFAYWYESVHGMKRNIDTYQTDPLTMFIFDRYNISNAIYNPMNGTDVQVSDLTYDNDVYGIPKPDIVVWLKMSNFDVYSKMLMEKSNKDENEKDLAFIKEIYDRSEKAIGSSVFKDAGIHLIPIDVLDCDRESIRSREDIFEEVWNSIIRTIDIIHDENGIDDFIPMNEDNK